MVEGGGFSEINDDLFPQSVGMYCIGLPCIRMEVYLLGKFRFSNTQVGSYIHIYTTYYIIYTYYIYHTYRSSKAHW